MSKFTTVSLVCLSILLELSSLSFASDDHHTWELPSKDPDRIVLTLTEKPSTSMSVSWRSSNDIKEAWAELAVAFDEPGFSKNAEKHSAKTQFLDLSQVDYNPKITSAFHSVTFDNLLPDTTYAYRVGDGKKHMSEWFHFTTAKDGFAPFSFVYVGDAQNGILSHWSRLIRQSFKSKPDMNFLLHAGDLINTAHMDAEWGQWFKALGWIHGSVPAVAIPGNHEYGLVGPKEEDKRVLSIQWKQQFEFPIVNSLPDSLHETAYSFEYQGVLFVALNSISKVDQQTKWLKSVLKKSKHQWKVVAFHYPIFASATDRDNLKLRSAWKPLFDEFNVDLVIQGHDHTYARGHTKKLKAGSQKNYVKSIYVNSVSGSKMYEVKPERWNKYENEDIVMDRMAENTQLFQAISVEHRKISYQAITATGKVYDSFTLEKLQDGSKILKNGLETLQKERTFKNTLPY